MEVTNVRVNRLVIDDSPVKAIVSITLDDVLVINSIKLIQLKNKTFLSFPERRVNEHNTYCIAHPISDEFRKEITKRVLSEYQQKYDEYVIKHAEC